MGKYPVMKNPRAPMSAKSEARFSIFNTKVKIAQVRVRVRVRFRAMRNLKISLTPIFF
jgi:hypothetical protein